MSVWLTPDLKPFIGGTYFPPRDHGRRPGLKTVLTRIIEQVEQDSEAPSSLQINQIYLYISNKCVRVYEARFVLTH